MSKRYTTRQTHHLSLKPKGPLLEPKSLWILQNLSYDDTSEKMTLRTIEKRVEIVIVHFAEFDKVFTELRTGPDLQIDDDVAERRFQQNRHRSRRENIRVNDLHLFSVMVSILA